MKYELSIDSDQKEVVKQWIKQQKIELKRKQHAVADSFDKSYCWAEVNIPGFILYVILGLFLLISPAVTVSWYVSVLIIFLGVTLTIFTIAVCENGHNQADTWFLKFCSFCLIPCGYLLYKLILLKDLKKAGLLSLAKYKEEEKTESINNFVFDELSSRQNGLISQIDTQSTKLRDAKFNLDQISYNLRSKGADPERINLVAKLIVKIDSQLEVLSKQKTESLNALGDIQSYVQKTNETIRE